MPDGKKGISVKWKYWTCARCGLPLIDKHQVRDYYKNHVNEDGKCPFVKDDKKGLPLLNISFGLK